MGLSDIEKLLDEHLLKGRGKYNTDSKGNVQPDTSTANKIQQKEKEIDPQYREVKQLLTKYLDDGTLSEKDFLKLKQDAIEKGLSGDTQLMEITDRIENNLWRQQEIQTKEELHLGGLERGAEVINSLSTLSTTSIFSVSIVIALGVLGFGLIWPRIQRFFARSARGSFLLMVAGFAVIAFIIKLGG